MEGDKFSARPVLLAAVERPYPWLVKTFRIGDKKVTLQYIKSSFDGSSVWMSDD